MTGIYKAYDIRGLVGKELDEELAFRIGRAFARALKLDGKRVLVAQDMRESSPAYANALIHGLLAEGARVTDAGLASTPLFYFATREYDAGVMVTASHNPKEYNGFKLCREAAIPVSYETGIKEVERLVAAELAEPVPDMTVRAPVEERSFLPTFLAENLSFLKPLTRSYRVVVDAGNGMGGLTYAALTPLLAARNITLVPLYFEPDGSFPNHEANPLKEETLTALKEQVKTEHADFGLALDGDGDRCLFIDERGETVRADFFLALIARELLVTHPGALILHDLRSSKAVREAITAAGGKARMCRVGHAYIKAQMREEHALLAGELSGHFYPGEENYTENTMYALFQLLNLLDGTGGKLSALVAPLQQYAFSGEINSRVADADAILTAVKTAYAAQPGVLDVSEIDGIRVEFTTWWFSLRKSNTEPVIRLIVEADTDELMREKRDELLAIVRR